MAAPAAGCRQRYAAPLFRCATAKPLGAYFRHCANRLGADVAAFATARMLATRIYRLLRWGHAYVDEGAAYELRYHARRISRLQTNAAQLGYSLVAAVSE